MIVPDNILLARLTQLAEILEGEGAFYSPEELVDRAVCLALEHHGVEPVGQGITAVPPGKKGFSPGDP